MYPRHLSFQVIYFRHRLNPFGSSIGPVQVATATERLPLFLPAPAGRAPIRIMNTEVTLRCQISRWWSIWESNPSEVTCKASLYPSTCPRIFQVIGEEGIDPSSFGSEPNALATMLHPYDGSARNRTETIRLRGECSTLELRTQIKYSLATCERTLA
jgi:hypothetical protein